MNRKEIIDFFNKQMTLPEEEREFVYDDSITTPTPFFDEIEKISHAIFGDLDDDEDEIDNNLIAIENNNQYYCEDKNIVLPNFLGSFFSQFIFFNKNIEICDNKQYNKTTKVTITTLSNYFDISSDDEIERLKEAA